MENINFLLPRVSVVIVNYNGEEYIKNCIESIGKVNYDSKKLEIVVIDNGSKDNSVNLIRANFPQVKLITNKKNIGFAPAVNMGAKEATGKYIAIINNDIVVDKNWLIELVKAVSGNTEVVCAGSKVLNADGTKIDFVGGMVNFEGKGFQIDYGKPLSEDIHNQQMYYLFANGSSMLVDREVFLEADGFDEDFFAYYEDVDFGWRLWVLGYKVVFVPTSIVYHVHHGTSKAFSEDKLRFLKERNSLYSVFKNYDDENLARVLSASLASVFNRIFVDFKFDYKNYYRFDIPYSHILDMSESSKSDSDKPLASHKGGSAGKHGYENWKNPGRSDEVVSKLEKAVHEVENLKLTKEPLSSLMAIKDFLDSLPKLREKREKIQKKRRRDDKAIFSYFRGQFLAVSPDKDYQEKQIEILKSLGIYELFQKKIKRTLLIVSGEVVSKEMAGPGIRVWNFAKVLSQYMNVILAIPNEVNLPEQEFRIVQYKNDSELRDIIKDVDIILSGGTTFFSYPSIKNSDKFLIMDMYDPYNLASLAEYKDEPIEKRLGVHKLIHYNLNEQLYYGDFFICASERQRDFWLGMLAALNRVNPYSYHEDPTLRKMIDIVPFGLPSNRPLHTENVLKGVVKSASNESGIYKNDFVVIWGGGIYNWFDPLTLIKAMAEISRIADDVKLFFLGVKHPNPQVKELQMVDSSVALAKKLGVYEKNVFFNFGWVEYEKRHNYLLESDVGIITHPLHIETRFSYRTRALDYIWAGLPIISTRGDSLSDLIEKEGLGITVREGNIADIVEAILKLKKDKKFYEECVNNIERIARQYTWEKVCQPLIKFCKDPVVSAYKKKLKEDGENVNGKKSYKVGGIGINRTEENTRNYRRKGLSYLIRRFLYHLTRSGLKKTFQYLSNYISGRR